MPTLPMASLILSENFDLVSFIQHVGSADLPYLQPRTAKTVHRLLDFPSHTEAGLFLFLGSNAETASLRR
jgi:hypothetical protein